MHYRYLAAIAWALMFAPWGFCDDSVAPLPAGVKAEWDLGKAYRQTTATRERVCLNGLWRWQPNGGVDAVPADGWGYFKVPGCWPGITDYLQKDCQTVYPHAQWRSTDLGRVTAAWYQREFSVPAEWGGRRIALRLEYLNSLATAYVDGAKAGELRFPGGELDITAACRPRAKHVLSLHVAAIPLKGVMLSYTDSAHAREVKGSVERRGLCGDVYLVSVPMAARIGDVKVRTSVRKGEISVDAAIEGLAADGRYVLRARILDGSAPVAELNSRPFTGADLSDRRFDFAEKWKPAKLWDLNTPGNGYDLQLELRDAASGRPLDVCWPEHFAFREFWIDGRDFYLNGKRVFLSAVPLDNASVGAAWASYAGAKESLSRLKSIGINFVYGHNYGCQPGSHLSFAEVLRAADEVGMLVALSQPHFSDYEWKAPDADRTNGYARHAAFYVDVAGDHPSVVAYAMSHNATGYEQDMNPDMIDGIHDPRDQWSARNAKLALRAEAIVEKLDPGRVVYHHASGNLGSMHAVNYYANFSPIQEQSDWFEHWAATGVKPLFTCEYGVPFTWDWTMYRGWYKGEREFGSAKVPWELCIAEWNSQFLGDAAFRISDAEKADLRWEAKQFRAGNTWQRWDYPFEVSSTRFDERYPVLAMYISDNWRAFRTWGVSATSPWEYEHFWKLREGVDKRRRELPVDWETLQRPGFSADYIDRPYERMDLAFEKSDWAPTVAAQALIRNNGPLLAYIAGKSAAFTSKDQNFRAGESFEKTLILINNSRRRATCRCTWSLGLPQPVSGTREAALETGEQARIPLQFDLPAGLRPGQYQLTANFHFDAGEEQSDSFTIHVLPPLANPRIAGRIALFDPQGETTRLLKGLGITCDAVDAGADLSGVRLLVVGKGALTVDGPAPNLARVRDGMKVIVFEQTPAVLEKRLGFRVAEYGLRWVFKRVPDHPALAGLSANDLRNWRGEATILPPRLEYELRPRFGPTIKWCDIPVPQIWRCGNRGDVASALIEKPAWGDFRPIIDGGFSLQYSPLLEYHEGRGLVMFCQLDVTGRTEKDPAAEILAANLLGYASAWKPVPARTAVYEGESAGLAHLNSAGVSATGYDGKLSADQVLIVGPGGTGKLAGRAAEIAEWLEKGGHLLAVGLDENEANAILPFKIEMKKAEHIAAEFEPFSVGSLLAGVGPADLHNRDPRELNLVTGGATVIGDGVLAIRDQPSVVFCQMVPWQFQSTQVNVRRTWRRSSFLLTRLLANLGVQSATPILERFSTPVVAGQAESRCLGGLYVDRPEEWDYPYRFFRW